MHRVMYMSTWLWIQQLVNGVLDTSLPCHFAPISKVANSKFTIVIEHTLTLTLNPNSKGLNPNLKSQTKTPIPYLKSVTLCPNPYCLKS